MQTTKQLISSYISLTLDTLSESEYKVELIRYKYIISGHPKPQRTKLQQDFCDFIQKKIYCNHTACDLFYDKFGVNPSNASKEQIVKIFGTFDSGQIAYNKISKEATILINSYYDKYRIELNELYYKYMQEIKEYNAQFI